MSLALQIRAQRAMERRKAAAHVIWDLERFCVEVLGYDKISPAFHGPMLREWDRVDRERLLGGRQVDTLDLWPRDHIKTWCERARIIRAYCVKPDLTVTWWHAVEEMAQESAVAVGKTLQECKELRAIFPDGVLPSPMAKKFVTATGFSLKTNRLGDAPSMRAWGVGSEATGGHSNVGVLDDPIGFNDIMDNQLGQRRRWYQSTARNVVRTDGWFDVIGTRWDREDLYQTFMDSGAWKVTLRACLEKDGVPDYNGDPVYLTREQIERKRKEIGPIQFAYQMMNDVSQSEARPWVPETCETFIPKRDALEGPGFWVLIMDPAAAQVGDEDWEREKKRADGQKNYWAMQVWKIRRREQNVERILMDAASSREWSIDEGMNLACNMILRWAPQLHHAAIEDTVPYVYLGAFKRTAQRRGIHASTIQLLPRGMNKNVRWGAFCGRAQAGEVFICKETVPKEQIERLLDQARRWVPRGKSNGLSFDDEADCAAYVVDPEIESYAPKVRYERDEATEWSPYRQQPKEGYQSGSRYIRW